MIVAQPSKETQTPTETPEQKRARDEQARLAKERARLAKAQTRADRLAEQAKAYEQKRERLKEVRRLKSETEYGKLVDEEAQLVKALAKLHLMNSHDDGDDRIEPHPAWTKAKRELDNELDLFEKSKNAVYKDNPTGAAAKSLDAKTTKMIAAEHELNRLCFVPDPTQQLIAWRRRHLPDTIQE